MAHRIEARIVGMDEAALRPQPHHRINNAVLQFFPPAVGVHARAACMVTRVRRKGDLLRRHRFAYQHLAGDAIDGGGVAAQVGVDAADKPGDLNWFWVEIPANIGDPVIILDSPEV